MMNFFAIQLHVKDSRTARVIVQPKTGPFAARACYLPSTSREFEVDIFRLAAFAPFSLFAFSIFKRTLAVSHARLNDFLFCNIG